MGLGLIERMGKLKLRRVQADYRISGSAPLLGFLVSQFLLFSAALCPLPFRFSNSASQHFSLSAFPMAAADPDSARSAMAAGERSSSGENRF